ncbi:hypothetical protein SRHO_G00314900 [Serrasalmus rhombeus]
MDLSDPSVLTPILFVAAHFLTAAGVWLYRRRRLRRTAAGLHDERDRVQKKTFTKWVNKHLIKVRKHITDLYEDLRDGHNLISLLEVLSGVTLPREKGRMRFHRLQNVQIALDFLKQRQVKLVNIRNDDITDGNPKLTLGLIWTIILHFQISEIYVSGESGDLTAKEKLLLWTQQATEGYHGLRCVNFSSSWSDGRMFNALLHRYRPDLIDMELVAQQTNRENLEQAFEIAESLGVTRLLDAEDVDVPSPDEKSVITYVSSIYDAFPKIPEGGEGIKAHEVDQQWAEYQSRFSSLLQWTRQHTALMANKGFPQNPVELKALYNEYIHFKETEIPAKELEKGHIKHLYKLLEVWIEFGRIKLPQGLHPNDLEEEWGKLILEMLEREKALRPAVERLELLLQMANKFQNMAVDCEEKLTLAKNTLQVDTSHLESGEPAQCEQELGAYLQDCEALVRQLHLDLQVLRDEKYYQVEQLAFRVTRLQEELVSLRLQCSSVYRKGHFSSGGLLGEQTAQRGSAGSLPTLGAQTLLGAIGAVATLMRQPMSRSDLVAISSSEDEGSLRFIYELLGWVEETQELLERAEWGSDLPSVEQHLQDHHTIHTTVEELLHSLKEARSYEPRVSPNFRSSYSETLAKLENQYCKLLEHSSWRLRCLESLRAFVSHCTEELIWLNEKEEEELAFDWSENTTNMTAKREQYTEMRSELEEKQKVMRSLQETADQLCQDNHPAKQTVEAYSAALQTQWQWVRQLCICVEQHLKDNTAYFLFMSDARECETYLRQLQDTIKRQYTCDKNSRLGKLEDLLQDSMEEKEQLIEYRSSVASLVGRAKTVVQLRPRSADCILGTTTPIRAICDYRQIEITVSKGEECVLEDNSQRTKWKIISPTGNEAMVPSVCFTVPPPNKEAIDTANRMEQLYQNVMSLWHRLHMNMKSVVTWHYLQKDINNILSWTLDTVRSQSLSERQQALEHLNTHLTDFLADSHESTLFTPSERRELEKEVANCGQHCQALLISMETVEKDESISRTYLSELQSIKSHLQEAEQRLMRGLQASPPSGLSGGGADTAIHIAEQEKLQQDLKGLQSDLGNVSRRCVSFFEEKPTSSSVPVLRSELNLAVEKIERLNSLSSVYLQKLKTVDVLMRSLQVAESQVKKYEGRLSEEDIVPADTTAIQALREQLKKWHLELEKQDHIFQSLSLEMQQAREAGTQLSQLHSDRSPEMDRYQEKAHQLTERWNGVRRQMETRLSDLEMLGSVLQQYRAGHSALIHWIEETTAKQENTQPEQTDSKALSEQLAQQTALVAEIEQNQVKLDECQNHSKHYCTAVKDYELQLMTFRAFVESTQKSPVKRRRMHSSSDAITQEFMDLRTRYTALVTLTTQHVKYISDALRRLEEEEKQVEEERQARVGEVSELLSWVKGLQERPAESSLAAQQAINEQLASKKEEITEAIRSTEVFLLSKQASKLSAEERAQVTSQLDDLTATYKQLCDSSAAQLQQLEEQLAKEEKRKDHKTVAGVIDLETMETFPVFQSARRGLIDQDTCRVLLESQLVMGGLLQPDSPQSLSLEESLATGLIDNCTYQSLLELETALHLVQQFQFTKSQFIPVAAAVEMGHIKEQIALRILELQLSIGGLLDVSSNEILSLENAMTKGFLSVAVYNKLHSRLDRRELIDPNTAEKLNLSEFHQRCVLNQETGLRLLPVNQQSRGTVCLRSGRKVSVFRAVQEGLIDQQVTIRLLEAQLFAGGITDPRSGHRLTVDEAVRLGLMDQDLACALLTRQLQTGGIIDPASGERLELNEAIQRDLLSSRMALRVLESQWSFMGMIWPESGELLSISDALQQGVVSGELAWKFLSKRHFVGALYCPESGRVVPLACAEKILGTEVVKVLEKTRVPDALPAMISSGSLNVSRWGSSSSPLLSSPAFSPPHLHDDTSFLEGAGSEEQVQYRLLCYLMTHSYINAGSGERLVLLEPELIELICQPTKDQSRPEPHLGEPSDREKPDFSMPFSEPEQRNIENLTEAQKRNVTDNAVCETKKVKSPLEEDAAYEEKSSTDRNLVKNSDNALELAETVPEVQTLPSFIKQVSILPTNSVLDLFTKEVKEIKREETVLGLTDPRPLSIEMPKLNQCLLEEKVEAAPSKNKRLGIRTENTAADISFEDAAEESQDGQVDQNDRLDKINLLSIAREGLQVKKIEVTDISDQMDTYRNTEKTDSSKIPKMISMEQIDEDAELEDMAKQLLQGGLLTDGAQKLLLDKAVSQGVLLGHTAVKVMSKAGLFGGFLDVSACKSLSVEDVMQEGLLDEDLLKSVLQSEKTLAGVIDVEHNQICSLKDAAQTGLLDPDTVARLLEAQVVSGGIVDLRRGKKVSVTLAANFGLIEEAQKEDLLAMEKSCHGKSSDPYTSHTKLTLQLQMDGVVDPKTKQSLSLQQAIQKGIIGHKEAQQILMQQVAEGGIVHHGSGVRLSVADSVQQGLIDKSFVQKLEDFEKSCQRQEQFGSDPNSISVQASVGFICDSVSKSRLALTEAVSCGFIDEDTANKAMASPNVISGLLDPHSACIVPYSELINQGKIDIETGQRFLEVRPFRGVPQKQNGGMMTLPEAVKIGQVDPVPALRVLQSQADSGGIINISDGKRLTIPEAVDKGLVEKDIARVIATNQIVKGGLINPSSGHRVSDLKEAVQEGLISREMAAELQDNFDPVDEPSYKEEGTATVGPSTSGMYSPLVSNQVSHSNSQHESTEVSAAHLSESEKTDCMITEVLEAPQPEKTQLLQHYAPYEMEEQTHKVISSSDLEINTDASLEVLTHFALKTEKRLQQAIKDFDPDIYKELQHQPSEVQIPQLSETEFENGKKYDTTPTPDHPPESDSQMQPEVELAPTKTYTKLENYEKSGCSIAPDTTHTIHDGQTPSSEETNGQFSKAAEQQSSSYVNAVCESKQNVENGKGVVLFTTEAGQKIQVKKSGKGKYVKQARIGTKRDESLDSKSLDENAALPSEGTEINRNLLDTHEESVKEGANLQKEEMTGLEDGNSTTVNLSHVVDVENKILKDVPDIDHEEVQVNLEVRELSVVTPPENKSIRAMAGFDPKTVEDIKEKKVEVQLESLTTQDMSVASFVKDTESKTGNYVLGIDKKSADGKNDIKEYLEVQQPLDLSVTSTIESTENKSGKEAVVIDQKTEEYGKLEQEDKLRLNALQHPDINVVPPVDGTDNRMRPKIGVIDQESIDVKLDLVTQPPGLSMTSLVEDIKYKSGNEAFDQESEVKLEKNDKLDSQVILNPGMSIVPLVEGTGKTGKKIEVTDEIPVEDVREREAKVDLGVQQSPDWSKTSLVVGIGSKSEKETVDQESDVKFEKKDKSDLEVLLVPTMSIVSSVEGTEKTGKKVVVTDEKSVKDVKERDDKVDLDSSMTSLVVGIENKSEKEAVNQASDVKLEKKDKLELEFLLVPDMCIVSSVEGTEKTGKKVVVTDEKYTEDLKVEREAEVQLESRPDQTDALSVVGEEYETGKCVLDSEQTSIERNEKMEKLVKVKLTGAPEISYSIAFPGGLQQSDVVEEAVVSIQKQPTEDEKMSLGAEMAKEEPASLQDDYNSDHELHSQMQHQGINETNPEYDKEVDASEVHVPEQTDKKSKKKKRKMPKEMLPSMANAEKEAEEDTDVVTSQSEKLDVVETERMEQPQKPHQVQLEKETLLMKAKQSILKKVFERGVTEKQAAKELEALRQGSGKERHVAIHQKPNIEQDSSTFFTREKDETHQKMQVNTNEQLVAGDVAGTNSKQNYYSQTAPDISHLRSSVSVTQPASDLCKKQDLSTKETSHVVAMDTSKQRLTHIDLDEKVGERTTEQVEHESLWRRSSKIAIKTSQVSEQLWPALDEGYENSEYDFTESLPTVTFAREPATVLPIEFTKNEAEKPGLTTLEVNEQSYTTLSEGKSLPPIKLDKDSASLPQCDVDVQTSKTEPNSSSTELLQDIVKDYGHVDSEAKDEAFLQESRQSGLSQSEDIPESDVTEQEKEEEEAYEGVDNEQVDEPKKKQGATPQISKSSLARQECLEHDQRILALLSMVRHTEVCLKQQQQQSVGRSLLALDDIIKQTETLALELCDLEPQVNKELEASRQLLGSHLEDVPPQLLMALEKDGRSLSRAFDAARELSQSVQQGMKSHRDARKVAVNNELQSLGGQVDNLLVWLKQTEAQMEQHTREEKMMENESRTLVHLAQRLQQCKELEEHLATHSSDVSTVAFDIQVFISECAQDLEPEQSRHLLRQLQQLQRAFHQATGRAHARAEALSVQQAREEEREQKEKEQEEREREKEKQTAMKKEIATEDKRLCLLGKG